MSIVSCKGMLVKRLSILKDIIKLLLRSKLIISSTKEKESLVVCLSGMRDDRMEHKYLANLQL